MHGALLAGKFEAQLAGQLGRRLLPVPPVDQMTKQSPEPRNVRDRLVRSFDFRGGVRGALRVVPRARMKILTLAGRLARPAMARDDVAWLSPPFVLQVGVDAWMTQLSMSYDGGAREVVPAAPAVHRSQRLVLVSNPILCLGSVLGEVQQHCIVHHAQLVLPVLLVVRA